MRVLLIDVNCKSSSTGQLVYNLYTYLNYNGDEAAVCYGRGEHINEKNIYKFGIDCETYIHALLTRVTGYTGCFSFFSTRRLIGFIDNYEPDVVHIHELHAYFVNIKQLLDYLAKKNIKVVHTLHCEFSYTGKCGHSIECDKWKTECGNCPHLKNYPSTFFFDHTRYMQTIKKNAFAKIKDLTLIAPSRWLAERAKQSFFSERKIEIIHNGIDTEIYKLVDTSSLRKELGLTYNEKVVLALAPNLMSREKGGEYVIQIANIINDARIRFILVGVDNPDSVKERHFIVKGRTSDKELLAQYYNIADVFLICSERENFPTTCLEAQCCGTPVYGFDTGGVRETCVQGHYLVNYQDIYGLAEAIKKAEKKDPANSEALSLLAIEKYGAANYSRKHINLYKEIMRNDV